MRSDTNSSRPPWYTPAAELVQDTKNLDGARHQFFFFFIVWDTKKLDGVRHQKPWWCETPKTLMVWDTKNLHHAKNPKGVGKGGGGDWIQDSAAFEKYFITLVAYFMSASVPQAYRFLTFEQYQQNIKIAALGHKMWQFNNYFLQSYVLLIFFFT